MILLVGDEVKLKSRTMIDALKSCDKVTRNSWMVRVSKKTFIILICI